MKFTLDATDANQIHHYNDHEILINPQKQKYVIEQTKSLIITPDKVITDFTINDITKLSKENLNALICLAPEIILFTTGPSPHLPVPGITAEFSSKAIGVEFMALGPACRTFNLLVSEGRQAILVIATIS